jgi:HEAT repeat protein
VILAIALLCLPFPWPTEVEGAIDEVAADRAARQSMAERLARSDAPSSSERLRVMLDDLDGGVRATAARALARRSDKTAEAALAAAARWVLSGNSGERGAGLEVLRAARVLTPASRAALERALADTEPTVKLMALEVLSDKDVRPSLAAVAGALEDSAATVRLMAIRLLADARDPRAALALLGRTADADRLVRREAIAALGALGDQRTVPALLRLLEAPVDDIRRAAIEALAGLKAPSAISGLTLLARRKPADQLARHAQWALGEIGTPEALAVLVALLREPPVTDETRQALARVGARAVPLLARELDADGGAAAEAAALLGGIGDRRAVGALLALTHRRNQALPAALRALAALRRPEAVATLVVLASDPSKEIRRLVLDALAATADDRAVVVLEKTLRDPDPGVRMRAATLAGRLRARAQIATLATLLRDAPPVRESVISALGALGGPEACAALVQAAPSLADGGELPLVPALEATAVPGCLPALTAAARRATGAARAALLRGLIAAVDRSGAGSPGLEDAMEVLITLINVGVDDGTAERAAEALAAIHLGRRDLAEVIETFPRAPAPVRARLCPALAASASGRNRLVAVLADRAEDDEVRAAAAWSLAGAGEPQARRALERAASALLPALADNARAALAVHPAPAPSWVTLRLQNAAGRPLPRAWLRVVLPGGARVWARSGQAGEASVRGLPPGGPLFVELDDPAHSLEGAPDAVGKIARE